MSQRLLVILVFKTDVQNIVILISDPPQHAGDHTSEGRRADEDVHRREARHFYFLLAKCNGVHRRDIFMFYYFLLAKYNWVHRRDMEEKLKKERDSQKAALEAAAARLPST